jgi:hypothetical protein
VAEVATVDRRTQFGLLLRWIFPGTNYGLYRTELLSFANRLA